MKIQTRFFFVDACVFACVSFSFAQTNAARPVVQTAAAPNQINAPNANLPGISNSTDILSGEIGNLRKSLQPLNKRLSEIGERIIASAAKDTGAKAGNQTQILLNFDVLARAEQRAEILRRELIALIEKDTQLKSRAVQTEEDMRPENIDRTLTTAGSTRAPELRDARRRVLENERDGQRALLMQVQQSRQRLENDVREADSLVNRLRQRILPIIERELQIIDARQP